MALTKKMLKALGLTDEQIESIFEGHEETVNGLKAEIKDYEEKYGKVAGVEKDYVKAQARIDELEDEVEKLKGVKAEYEKYKDETEASNLKRTKEAAYRKLLAEAKISEKRYDSIMRVTDMSGIELDENGEIKNKKKVLEAIDKEWEDFKVTVKKQGMNVSTPPEGGAPNTFDSMNLAEKMTYANENPDAQEVKDWLAK